jgi:hypothetical protein
MRVYNFTGYSLIIIHVLAAGLTAPEQWGFVLGAAGGFLYLLFIWFFGGMYLSNVMHMGIAHKTLAFKEWFTKSITLFFNLTGTDFGFMTVRAMKAMGLVKAYSSGSQMPAGIPLKDAGF